MSAGRRALGRAALVAVALASGFAAQAYVPTVSSLIRRAAARVDEGGKPREATLTGWLYLGSAAPVQATLGLKFPFACKLDAPGLAVSVRGDAARQQVKDDGHAGARDLLRLACPLIAYRGQTVNEADRSLRVAAAQAGLPPELGPTSLARLYDRVAIVLGAQARQLDRPQLWLYKDNGAPARLLSRQENRLDDLRLLQYGNPASADWLPRVLELWHGEQLVARFETLETRGMHDLAEEGDDAPGE